MRVVGPVAALLLAAVIGFASAPAGAQPVPSDPVGTADGGIPPGVTLSPYAIAHPAVAGLDARLRRAVQDAAAVAAAEGIELRLTSGWRSAALQQRMLDDAVINYGGVDAARRWVALPQVSRHVTGGAVDIGPPAAAQWLAQHGARFGLCRVYANEMWHFELTADEFGTCPPLLPDAGVEWPAVAPPEATPPEVPWPGGG
ncbi:M15 family metallopeptidase [Mycolicibacterium thermoresistibile]